MPDFSAVLKKIQEIKKKIDDFVFTIKSKYNGIAKNINTQIEKIETIINDAIEAMYNLTKVALEFIQDQFDEAVRFLNKIIEEATEILNTIVDKLKEWYDNIMKTVIKGFVKMIFAMLGIKVGDGDDCVMSDEDIEPIVDATYAACPKLEIELPKLEIEFPDITQILGELPPEGEFVTLSRLPYINLYS
jgi:hypothetical protein